MSGFNRVFSGTGLRGFALIVVFAVLAMAIWFLGPWLGFGEVTPWASIENRIIMLVLLSVVILLRWYRLPLFLDLTLIAATMVWIIGPYILVGDRYPLSSVVNRCAVIALLLLVAGFWGGWRLLQALAANPNLLNSLVSKKAVTGEAKPDMHAISRVIAAGMKHSKCVQRAQPLWRRFFRFNDSEVRLPWFMVIGPESAGKTMMLFSSGLDFPHPEQLNRKDHENPPTEHVECLYTNDALFLDTSGKYLQETPPVEQEWRCILGALRKYRPKHSIHGMVVALSVADILQKNQADRLQMAAVLRLRLSEAREMLGLRFPVYVNITHMDMLTGFSAYFRNLTAAEREQVLGVTLPFERQSHTTAAELGSHINDAFNQLEERLSSALCQRQLEEFDVTDRKQMYALPQDFRLLIHGVTEMLQHIFLSSRYDETQFNSTLRGIYFMSSCQVDDKGLVNNNTVIQRWYNVIEDKNPESAASYTQLRREDGVINSAPWGRHYFLRQLFSNVITADHDLVSSSLRMRTRDRLKNFAGHCAAILLTVWLLWGIVTSFQLNKDYLNVLDVRTQELTQKVTDYVKHPQPLLPGVLYSTHVLAQYLGLDINHPPLNWRYGLFMPRSVEQSSDKLYTFFLQNALLPNLQRQAGNALNEAVNAKDIYATWDALKLYLMLKDRSKFDKKFLISKINKQSKITNIINAYGEQATFDNHLDALFSSTGWQEKALPLDQKLVKNARNMLAQLPQTHRIWQNLKQKLLVQSPPNVTLQGMIDPQAPMIFKLESPGVLEEGIPGIFTRDGWRDLVKKQLSASLVGLQSEDGWVLGKPVSVVDPLRLHEEVLTLYLQEYAQYWQRFLSSIRLIPMSKQQNLSMDVALLRALVADNSPLRGLLERAVTETTLKERKDKTLQNMVQGTLGGAGRLAQQASKLQQSIAFREQSLLNQYVDFPFSSLRRFVRGSQEDSDFNPNQTVGLNRLMNLLTEQYTRYAVYNGSLGRGDIPVVGIEGSTLAAEALTWPEPVKGILMPLLGRSSEAVQKSIVKVSVNAIENGVGQICRKSLQGRYPFTNNQQEISLAEFERLFAVDGIFDSWFKQNLADKVDTSSQPWRYKGVENGEGLAFFQKVAAVREALFDTEGRKVSLNLSVRVHYMAPAISQLRLSIGGETHRYSHGPMMPFALSWPVGGMSSVTMTGQRLPSTALPDLTFHGAWSVLRWLDSAKHVSGNGADSLIYQWSLGGEGLSGNVVELDISGLGGGKQSLQSILRSFRCPG